MSFIIDLCGEWELIGSDENGELLNIKAKIPGCVHSDLKTAGRIEDMFYRDNSKLVQWIERKDFAYKKTFQISEIFPDAYLEFDGLDTYCDIYLNGKKIGSADDMFLPYEFCVDGYLREGENTLDVNFRSPVREVEGLPLRNGAFTRERMHTRRIQCTYGWDWVDRFVTMGIYRAVRLNFRGQNEIADTYIFTRDINPYSAQLKLEINFRNFIACGDSVRIAIQAPSGETVFQKDRVILRDSMYEYIDIREPKLWFPSGYGEQPLYTVTVSTPTSSVEQKIGIRKITVIQLEDVDGSEERAVSLRLQNDEIFLDRENNKTTACFAVLVNGVKIMCKGANWVPSEPLVSEESPEKITRILELSAYAGVNMIRVWGGGIFERDEFYCECDRLGILVTQDFLMACGNYPEEEEWFITSLQREADFAVKRLRNHACLTFWSGDNENAEWGSENRTDFSGYRSAAYGLEPVVTALDPERYFFPSSPYGGDFYSCVTRGTTHITNYLWPLFQHVCDTDMENYREFLSRFLSRFCVEQPIFGMSFTSSLEKYLTDEDIFGEDLAMLEYHAKNNPYLMKSLFEMTCIMAQKIFGDYVDGEDRIKKLQMLGCEWTRLSFELYRRNKGYSWGLLFWMLNDCWPASSGWALIDYYACPKPAYYTFKRCAKPIIVTLSENDGKFAVHICNDTTREVQGIASLYIYNVKTGEEQSVSEFKFSAYANSSQKVFECQYCLLESRTCESSVILCDIYSKEENDRAMFVTKRFADLGITYAEPCVIEENGKEIKLKAEEFIPYVMLDRPCLLSDNCFVLKKGEERTVEKL